MGLTAGFWQKLIPVFLAPAVTTLVAARGGELEWESPAGTFGVDTDGENSLTGTIFLFQGVNLSRSYLGSSRLARERKSSDCLTDKEIEHGF
jgi:hypothetical protein